MRKKWVLIWWTAVYNNKKKGSFNQSILPECKLFLQSSELGLPHPLSRRRVYRPTLWSGGRGGGNACGRGGGRVPIPTREHTQRYSVYIWTLVSRRFRYVVPLFCRSSWERAGSCQRARACWPSVRWPACWWRGSATPFTSSDPPTLSNRYRTPYNTRHSAGQRLEFLERHSDFFTSSEWLGLR